MGKEKEAEAKHRREMERAAADAKDRRWTLFITQLPTILQKTAWIVGPICATLSIWCLAGQETIVKASISALADFKLNEHGKLAIIALLGAGNLCQFLAAKKLKKEAGRSSELEKQLDVRRTSSGLSPAGDPPNTESRP